MKGLSCCECFKKQHRGYLSINEWSIKVWFHCKKPSWPRGKPVFWSTLVIRWLCILWRPEQSLWFPTAYVINPFGHAATVKFDYSFFSAIAKKKKVDELGCGLLLMKTTIKHGEVWVCIHADICQYTQWKYPAWPSPFLSLSITHTSLSLSFSQPC